MVQPRGWGVEHHQQPGWLYTLVPSIQHLVEKERATRDEQSEIRAEAVGSDMKSAHLAWYVCMDVCIYTKDGCQLSDT